MKNKEKIIKTASLLFHQSGYNQTSVDKILEKSGVKKSNFYYHFKRKEELALNILDKWINEYESEVIPTTLTNPDLSPKNRLNEFYLLITQFHKRMECKSGCPFGNLAIEMSDINEKFRKRLSDFFMRWQKAIESCIQQGIEEGDFRDNLEPDYLAGLILSQLEGAIMMVKTHKTLTPLINGRKTVLKLLEA